MQQINRINLPKGGMDEIGERPGGAELCSQKTDRRAPERHARDLFVDAYLPRGVKACPPPENREKWQKS